MQEERAVIFDLDGVLVDSYWAHFESWQRLAKEEGVTFTQKHFTSTFGRTNRDIITATWRAKDPSDVEIEEIGERKEQLYREILRQSFPIMEGAKELIGALHEAGYKLAIGSSAPPENIEICLEKLAMNEHIKVIVSGADVSKGKPDPEVFLLTAEKLGVAPEACAVIEDAPDGIEAAIAAGMSAIALVSTGHQAFGFGHADLVLTSLLQLTPGFIDEIIDRRLYAETREFDE